MHHTMIWSGTKESDILYTNNFFSHSITACGRNGGNNKSYSACKNIRINYNKSNSNYVDFLVENLTTLIKDDPYARIMYYNPIYAYNLESSIRQHVCCLNPIELMTLLRSKCDMRMFASRYIPIVPFETVDGQNLSRVLQDEKYLKGAILQENVSSGGEGTYIVRNQIDIPSYADEKTYLLSPYYEENISLNINFVIFDENVVLFSPSVQIIEELNGKLIFMGTDYHIKQYDNFFHKESVLESTLKLAKVLQNMGYRGICGFDFLCTESGLLFLECNPRFQASTFLLNIVLDQKGLPSVQELNYMAFEHLPSPEFDFSSLDIPFSCITCLYQKYLGNAYYNENIYHSTDIYAVINDGFDEESEIENNAYLYRIVFSKSITGVTPEHRLITYENLLPADKKWYNMIVAKKTLALKIGLLNQGIQISKDAFKYMQNNGGIKNSVFDSIDIVLSNGMVVNCPYKINYAELSPFSIEFSNGNLELHYYRHTLDIIQLEPVDSAKDYQTTKNHIPYRHLSYLGGDRLRIHHTDICYFKRIGKPCAFCNLPIDGFDFDLSDIYEVLDYYLTTGGFRHILIGGGSNKLQEEYDMIIKLVKYIRAKTDIPIYVMCLPISNVSKLEEMHQAGVDEIGFNIELWDSSSSLKIMPGKGNIPRNLYLDALVAAKGIWKRKYAVRSLLVVGLEHKEIVKEAVTELCLNGIMPILSVFRPLPNSKLRDNVPPRNMYLYKLYHELEHICKEYNQKLGPDCVPCQNNTLSLP